MPILLLYLNTVVRVLSERIRLDRDGLVGRGGIDNVQLNLVHTSVKGSGAVGQVVLVGGGSYGHQKVDAITIREGDALNTARVDDVGETRGSRVGNLAHELTADVGVISKSVGAVLVGGGAGSSIALVDSGKSGLDRFTSINTLVNNVGQESAFVAKQINTVRSVKELLGQITEEVVLDEVLAGNNVAGSSQNLTGITARHHSSVGRVQLEISGPSILVDVILDIRGVDIVDIEGVGLELEHGEHIRQLHVEDSNGARVEGRRGLTGELTGNAECKLAVKGRKGEINRHYYLL